MSLSGNPNLENILDKDDLKWVLRGYDDDIEVWVFVPDRGYFPIKRVVSFERQVDGGFRDCLRFDLDWDAGHDF